MSLSLARFRVLHFHVTEVTVTADLCFIGRVCRRPRGRKHILTVGWGRDSVRSFAQIFKEKRIEESYGPAWDVGQGAERGARAEGARAEGVQRGRVPVRWAI